MIAVATEEMHGSTQSAICALSFRDFAMRSLNLRHFDLTCPEKLVH
jgi:hypothetical protein